MGLFCDFGNCSIAWPTGCPPSASTFIFFGVLHSVWLLTQNFGLVLLHRENFVFVGEIRRIRGRSAVSHGDSEMNGCVATSPVWLTEANPAPSQVACILKHRSPREVSATTKIRRKCWTTVMSRCTVRRRDFCDLPGSIETR